MSKHLKAAASGLLSKFPEGSEVIRIERSHLTDINREIKNRLEFLRESNHITDKEPRFSLGSTRLLARDLGGFDQPHEPYETMASFKRACDVKTSFGDIDIDVEMISTPRQIADAFEKEWKGRETHCVLCGGNEVNTAVNLDFNKIVQLDFVDVLKHRKETEYHQFSSFLDMAHNIKGLVRDILANSVTKTSPIASEDISLISDMIASQQTFIHSQCKAKSGEQVVFERVRWSLGHEELKMIAVFRKINKAGKELKTPYNIKVDDLNFIALSTEVTAAYSYTDMNKVARVIGLPNGDTMYHSILMLKAIKHFNLDRKQEIWDSIVKGLKRKRPTATAGGQLSNEEADATLIYLKDYFEGVNYGEDG